MNDAFGLPQSIVVIGGTSDLAHAILTELIPRGCRSVVLAGRDEDGLARAATSLETRGVASTTTIVFDTADPSAAAEVTAKAIAATDRDIDLVLIAVGQLGSQDEDEFDAGRTAAMIDVNFAFPAAVMAALAAHLRQQGHGRIVVLSSVAGVRVRRANFLYGAGKAGLDAYSVGLREVLAGTGVRVQVVRPGFVHSKMTEGRPAAPLAITPEVVARCVVRGIERNEPVIWAPGVLRWVFSVFKLLPQAVWRKLPG